MFDLFLILKMEVNIMKRSKKLVSVSLLVLMLGLITACGSRNAADNNGTGNTTNDNNAAGITDTGVN